MKLSLGGAWGRLGLGLALAAVTRADMLATEEPFVIDDGGNQFEAVLKGYAGNNHMEDMEEFTVVSKNGVYVYGETDEVTGNLNPTSCVVGSCNARAAGLRTRQTQTREARIAEYGEFATQQDAKTELIPKIREYKLNKERNRNKSGSIRRDLQTGMTLKNLVVLMRFKDHKDRPLPTRDQFEQLFNSPGTVPGVVPSVSIRTLFEQNSFGELTLDSVVRGWIDLNITEAEAAAPKHGIGSKALARAMVQSLEDLEAGGLNFTQFDVFNLNTQAYGAGSGDRQIDAVTFIHSGYGAEWGGTDCFGAYYDNRIWSHKYAIYPILKREAKTVFTSTEGIVVNTYHISPGLWAKCGSDMGRIGVIAHETGHFFGISDLYDTNGGGSGIGSFCLMANSWGFDGSQYYPPVMSAWTKIELGYFEPTEITLDQISKDTTFTIGDSSRHPDAFKISHGFPQGEYLLIENRLQVAGYTDYKIPGVAGLAIWHIDENNYNSETEGYPGMPGSTWPENGKHYTIALLQADGQYQLEKGIGRGSRGDLFNSQGAHEINPLGVLYADGTSKTYPNTDTYSGGNVDRTMIRIHDISDSKEWMTFKVGLYGGSFPTASPTKAPTPNPTFDPNGSQKILRTVMENGNGRAGNTFSIKAKVDVVINGFMLHIGSEDSFKVTIYTAQGGHFDTFTQQNKKASDWVLHSETTDVKGNGMYQESNLDIQAIPIKKGETIGFYVALDQRLMKYTNENDPNKRNSVTNVTDHIEFIQGFGMSETFEGRSYNGRIFNGGIKYEVPKTVIEKTPSPSVSQTSVPISNPTAPPTMFPTSLPTKFPTAPPTMFPTSNPVAPLTAPPTKFPTASPTRFPTSNPVAPPTAPPTRFPTSNPVASPTAPPTAPPMAPPTAPPTMLPISNPVASPTKFPTKNPTPNPTPLPTNGATRESRVLHTTVQGGNGQAGNMFEIVANRDIEIYSLSMHVDKTKPVEFYVFTKQGGIDKSLRKKYKRLSSLSDTPWGDYICHGKVKGNGRGKLTPLPEGSCQNVTINAGQTQSFYVTLTTGNIDYTNGPTLGAEFAKNNDLGVLIGYGKKFPFHRSYSRRVWNGEFKYTTLNDVAAGPTEYPLGPSLISGASLEGNENEIRDGGILDACEDDDDCDEGLICNASEICEAKKPKPKRRSRRKRGGRRKRSRGGTV